MVGVHCFVMEKYIGGEMRQFLSIERMEIIHREENWRLEKKFFFVIYSFDE